MYTLTDKLLVVSISILFILIVILCVFSANLAAAWLTNKREERKRIKTEYMERIQKRADSDRETWSGWLDEKDKKIEEKDEEYNRLKVEYDELNRKYGRLMETFEASERVRLKLMKGE